MNSFFNRGKRTCRTSQNPSLPSIESSYLRQSLRIILFFSYGQGALEMLLGLDVFVVVYFCIIIYYASFGCNTITTV